MKKIWLSALLTLMIFSLIGCGKKPEVTYVDTLPCDQASGYTWVARANSKNTGQVYIGQTYRDDETYALMGASGVLENAFAGSIMSTRWTGTATTAAQREPPTTSFSSMRT